MRDTTIVIPCYKPLSLLQSCISSIIHNTDLNRIEIIVVCNGSEPEAIDYLRSIPYDCVRFVWFTEGLGFVEAANIGLKIARTSYILLMNTDVQILNYWPKTKWLNELIDPLKNDQKLAVTGIAEMYYDSKMFLPFFCVGIKKKVLEELNYLDPAFGYGYGEDADFCYKATKNGYTIKLVSTERFVDHEQKRYVDGFPIYHQGRQSFGEQNYQALIGPNEQLLRERMATNFYN